MKYILAHMLIFLRNLFDDFFFSPFLFLFFCILIGRVCSLIHCGFYNEWELIQMP